MKISVLLLAASVGLGLATTAQAGYTLFAAESYPGSLGGDRTNYGALEQYSFAASGGTATAGAGIAASQLNDPVGTRFVNGKLYISNRFGNTIGQGSIQSADWNGSTLSNLTTIATASAPTYQGFAGVSFAPNGDMFVATVNSGTRRYHNSGTGFVDVEGTPSLAVRDTWVSPDGKKLFESTPSSFIRVTDIASNGSLGNSVSFTVDGSNALHQMTYLNGAIYTASFNSNTVHRIDLDSSYNPTGSAIVATVQGAIGLAFSPDGQELYVAKHSFGDIARLTKSGSTWTQTGTITTGKSMGYLAIVPEPSSFLVVGAGMLAIARRRRA